MSRATLRDRIGIDLGARMRAEDAVTWAARHRVPHIDLSLDSTDNDVTTFGPTRAATIRAAAEQARVAIGLHTSSAVNVAETAPIVAEAVDAYLRAYIDAAQRIGAAWIVVHAGFHFSSAIPARMQAGLDRLRRSADYAAPRGVRLLLENLNKEPDDAEVHYLAHTLAEWRWYYDRLDSPALGLSFTANHAHLVPEGVAGFLDAMPLERVAEVRLADCFRNGREEHLCPGQGDFDFPALFAALAAAGYRGVFTNAFGTPEDMLAARELFAGM